MIISIYRLLDGWHLINTVLGLTLVYVATVLPFTIWTLRGFVGGVPVELEEAAMIDGCTPAARVLPRHVPADRRRAWSPPGCSRSSRRGTSSSWRWC